MTLDILKKSVGFVETRMRMEERLKDICQVLHYALWSKQVSMLCIPVLNPLDGNLREDVLRRHRQNLLSSHPLLHVVPMDSSNQGVAQPELNQGPSLELPWFKVMP